MTLPTPVQMSELSKLIVEHGKITKGKWYTFKGMMLTLSQLAITSAPKTALTSGAAALGVSTGTSLAVTLPVVGAVAFVPFGAVLAPWIAVADIARQSGDIFELHDLKDHAAGKHPNTSKVRYTCQCGKCFDNIKYVVDKKERNVARIAIGVGTVGVSAVFTTLYSIGKSFQSGRPKEMTSRGLVESARGGCTVAIAAIFLLAGNWQFMRGGNAGTMCRAISIITSEDGWKVLKSEW